MEAAGQRLTSPLDDAEAPPDSEAASLLQPEAAEGSGTRSAAAPSGSAVGVAAKETERQADAAETSRAAEQPDVRAAVDADSATSLSTVDMHGDQQLPLHDSGGRDSGSPRTDQAEPAAGPDLREDQSLLSRGSAKSSDPSSEPQPKRQHDGGGGGSGSDADPPSSETEEVLLDGSPVHGAVMTNPYLHIEGAMHNPLHFRRHLQPPSSKAKQLLLAGLAKLPLEVQRALPESLLAQVQGRERQDVDMVSPLSEGAALPGVSGSDRVEEAVVMRKVNRHVLTRFFILTVLCYLDRTNLAFAALQLNRDLGFTEYVYGVGSSVFFFTYAAGQVPSNMALVRVGGPLWLGIIITLWGVVATCFAGLSSTGGFYALRLLLGLAEAGTFPGVWYMLTVFYTTPEVAVAYAIAQAGSVVSQVVGAPLAAALLALDDFLGLDGWQWLFLAEGLPTILFGIWLRYTLADAPATADFLTPAERSFLHRRNEAHKEMGGSMAEVEWEGILHWKTWALASLDACISTTKYALLYWTPLIIYHILGARNARAAAAGGAAPGEDDDAAQEVSEVAVALLTAVPFAVAAAGTVGNAWLSKRAHERRMHVVVPLCLSAAAMAALALVMQRHSTLSFLCLLFAMLAWAPGGILSAYPSSYLSGPAAASGWAVINAFGALLGGLAGPFLVGALKHGRGDYTAAMLVLAAVMAVGAAFAFVMLPIISPDVPPPSKIQQKADSSGGAEGSRVQLTDVRGAC